MDASGLPRDACLTSEQWPAPSGSAPKARLAPQGGSNLTLAQRHWKAEVVVASLEMLSGRSKKEYAKEAQAAAEDPDAAPPANGATADNDLEAVVAL